MQDNVVDLDRTTGNMSVILPCNTPRYALNESRSAVKVDQNRESIYIKVGQRDGYTADSTHEIMS